MKIFAISFVVLVLTVGASYQQSDYDTGHEVRDPFIPSHYDIQLRLITTANDSAGEQWTAPGSVRIKGVNQVLSNQIVLSAVEKMKINEKTLAIKSTGNVSQVFQVANIARTQYDLKITVTSPIPAGQEVELFIEFVAPIQETCHENRWAICNDANDSNEAVFSSRIPWTMYPCISEDHLRATFNLTLIRRNEFNSSLSNSPIISQIPDPEYAGWTVDTFAETPRMETEHLRFMISNYISIENKINTTGSTRPVKVHGPKSGSIKDQAVWFKLANYASKLMETYDEVYEGFKPVPKFDWVMLPHDRIQPSIDTWGIYLEENSNLDSIFSDQRLHLSYLQMVRILTNQRTKTNWNNVTQTKGEKNLDLHFGIRDFIKYLGHESVEIEEAHRNILKHKRQTMEVSRHFPNREPFSHKWATIVRMVQTLLTNHTFRKGFSQFLLHDDSSVSTFCTVMDNVSEQDGVFHGTNFTVKEIVESWVTKPGYAIVTVSVVNDTHLRLTQQGILQYEEGGYTLTNSTWNIPMFTISPTNKVPDKMVFPGQLEQLVSHNTSTWILANYDGRGLHRTLYDERILTLIREQLGSNYNAFDTLARSQLLNDYVYFAVNGFVNYTTTLNLMKYITNETKFEVIDEFAKLMQHLHEKFMFNPHYPILKNYMSETLKILWSTAKEQGKDKIFTGDVTSHYYTETTLDIISCQLGENSCVDWADRHINNWRANNTFDNVLKSGGSIVRDHMLCATVASGQDSPFRFLFDVFSEHCGESIDTSLKTDLCTKIVQSLACTSNITKITQLLDESWTWRFTSPSGVTILLKALASKPNGRDTVLNYLKKDFDRIHKLDKYYSVQEVIEILSRHYSTLEQLKMVQEFVSSNEEALVKSKPSLMDSIERIKSNIAWMGKQGHEIISWINQQE